MKATMVITDTTKILDEFLELFPAPEHDWRFRAGRMAEEIAELRGIVMRKEFRQELRKQADAEARPSTVVEQEAKAWAKHRRFNGPGSAMSWDQKDVEDAFVAGAQHGKSMQS